MLKQWIIVFVCIFIGVGIFSFSKVISLFQDKNSLNQQIEETLKPKISKLEKESARLNNELAKVRRSLVKTQDSLLVIEEESRVLKQELSSKRYDLKQAKKIINKREEELAKITDRHNELDSENKLLKEKFNAMFIEFLEMKKTLSSIEALKKAIRELKVSSKKNRKIIRVHRKKKTNKKIKKKKRILDQDKDKDAEIYGNSGYLIRDGKSTYVPKVRIRVLTVDE